MYMVLNFKQSRCHASILEWFDA